MEQIAFFAPPNTTRPPSTPKFQGGDDVKLKFQETRQYLSLGYINTGYAYPFKVVQVRLSEPEKDLTFRNTFTNIMLLKRFTLLYFIFLVLKTISNPLEIKNTDIDFLFVNALLTLVIHRFINQFSGSPDTVYYSLAYEQNNQWITDKKWFLTIWYPESRLENVTPKFEGTKTSVRVCETSVSPRPEKDNTARSTLT